MTRKHFQAIAEVMAKTRPDRGDIRKFEYERWERIVRLMADTLSEFNSNFNRWRFIEACEATYMIRDGKLVRA